MHRDITVVVTTFNRPAMLERAVASVRAQTLQPETIAICNDGDSALPPSVDACQHYAFGRAHNMFLSWYDAIDRCKTPFVAILHDDDWYEPTFLERSRELISDDVAYCFCEGAVHIPGKEPKANIALDLETGKHSSRMMGEVWLSTDKIITPSCALYRRDDLLRDLCPGNVPGMMTNKVTSGPDHLMALLPLLRYPRVAWIAEPLVHLDGGPQSTTICEIARDGGKKLSANYTGARMLYSLLRHGADMYKLAEHGVAW